MNRTLKLVRYAKLDKGWRRCPAVIQPNGKIKHPYMRVSGAEVLAPEGRYQIVRYEGSNPVYLDLGNDPTDALNRYKAEQGKQDARLAAIAAGWQIATPDLLGLE